MMGSDLTDSLAQLIGALQGARDDWWLIGGAAFLAHGVPMQTLKDIDVLVSFEDACRLLQRLDLKTQSVDGAELFRSRAFFQWQNPAIPVEFMAELKARTAQGWHDILPRTREPKALGGVDVFVPCAPELIEIGRLFGRPKDLARTQQLMRLQN